MAHIHLTKIRLTHESSLVGPGVKPFGRKAAGPKELWFIFDCKLLTEATKREVLEWIGENWDSLGETVTTSAANQRTVRRGSCG
jgi:hypothetical protein